MFHVKHFIIGSTFEEIIPAYYNYGDNFLFIMFTFQIFVQKDYLVCQQ